MNDASLSYVVQPFDLPKVKEEHLPGLFCDFGEVVSAHIATLREKRHPHLALAADFFQHLLETVDHDAFRRLQVEFVSPRWLEPGAASDYQSFIKYVDPIVWFSSKMTVAIHLGLYEGKPQRILDIGTGPGHFPTIARYFGHKVTATELPKVITAPSFSGEFYRALCEVYGIRRVPLAIHEFEPLPYFDDRFDLMTALLAAFNVDKAKQPWSIEAWNHFLTDLKRNVLSEKGRIYMSLAFGKITDEVWAHLESMSCYSIAQSAQIEIRDFTAAVAAFEAESGARR